ncbi:hypothetical protein M0Q50_06970 [bacterium]|jgi:hypothetical protein|nr:hypothetical protein [bacterium]
MATSKKIVEFTAKNVKSFTNWLKRFSLIDNTLLLEIDQSNYTFIAKTYNEERSVVKMSSIKFDEAGLTIKETKDKESKRIKVGIFNISRLIKIMDQFNDDEFNIIIEYQEITSENDSQFAAEKILFKNKQTKGKSLNMSVDCTSLNIFKYISDDLFNNTISAIIDKIKFDLNVSSLEKINNLNVLDNEYKFMEFNLSKGEIFVTGKCYNKSIGEITIKDEAKLSIFKEQFNSLDNESYDVILGDDRLVFKSKDSNTVIVISEAIDKD